MKPAGRIPLISPWLYRISVRGRVTKAGLGDISAVQELAGIFCTSTDPKARDLAARGLKDLPSQEQADLLCREALLRDSPALVTLVHECRYLPSAAEEQALFLFCTSRTGDLLLLDTPLHRPLLARGYAAAPAAIRARARIAARTPDSESLLARALMGTNSTAHAPAWNYGDWEIVIRSLIREKQWDNLWPLAVLAPLPITATAVTALKDAGWSPGGDGVLLWNRIAGSAVGNWTYPVPLCNGPAAALKPAGHVSRFIFSPDGTLLATGSSDGMITIRHTITAAIAAEFEGCQGPVRFLTITADNTCVLYGGEEGSVACFRITDAARLWSWTGTPVALAISHDGHTVLVAGNECTLHTLDISDGRETYSVPLHASPVTCLASSPCGGAAVCGHADGSVTFVRFGDTTTHCVLAGNTSPVRSLTHTEGGDACLIVYDHGAPALADPVSGTKILSFQKGNATVVCSTGPAGGGWFVTGTGDHRIRCFTLQNGIPVVSLPLYSRTITCCSAVQGSDLLALGLQDGTVRVYRMPDGTLIREFKGHKKAVTACTVSPDGSRLATVSWDGTLKVWELPGGRIVRTYDSHAGGIAALAGPAGTLLAAVTSDGIARVLDGNSGQRVRTIDLYTPEVRATAMSHDGSLLATSGADATLRLWSIRDGNLVATAGNHGTSQWCCAFVPDGTALITGGWDGCLREFRTPDLFLVRTLSGHTSTITCCAISRDGSLLVTGSNDTTLRLWRYGVDRAYAVLAGSRTGIGAVAISPDGTLLVAGSGDGVIRLFRLPYGTPDGEIAGLPGRVTALAFTRDGCTLVAGYDTGLCTWFSCTERRIIRTVPAHAGAVTGIAILPDNRSYCTTGEDGLCRFHTCPSLPFPALMIPDDVNGAGTCGSPSTDNDERAQWAFLRAVLAARFWGEIGICQLPEVQGCYDIQIVG